MPGVHCAAFRWLQFALPAPLSPPPCLHVVWIVCAAAGVLLRGRTLLAAAVAHSMLLAVASVERGSKNDMDDDGTIFGRFL